MSRRSRKWKRISWEAVAVNIRTGTETRPNEIVPDQIGRATSGCFPQAEPPQTRPGKATTAKSEPSSTRLGNAAGHWYLLRSPSRHERPGRNSGRAHRREQIRRHARPAGTATRLRSRSEIRRPIQDRKRPRRHARSHPRRVVRDARRRFYSDWPFAPRRRADEVLRACGPETTRQSFST